MQRRGTFLVFIAAITSLHALVYAQERHPHRFFVKLRDANAIRVQEKSKSTFTTASLIERAARWDVASLQQLVPQSPRSLAKGSASLQNIVVVTLGEAMNLDAAMGDFASDPAVEYVEPDHVLRLDFVPNDSAYASQWAFKKIGMEKAWDATQGSANITIGIIDTGVDYDHVDLASQLWINDAEDANHNRRLDPWPTTETRNGIGGDFDGTDNDGNGFIDDVIGYDFTDQVGFANAGGGDYNVPDPDPRDDFGHGTNVAGIIGAATDNRIGVAGIAPKCKLMVLRTFDARGVGLESDVARALAYAVDNGVHVVNMSFGDKTYSRVLRDVILYAYARGLVLVASAGNSTSDELHYPSAYDETISVAATSNTDGLAGFSNFGETVDLCAPGLGIVTTDRNNLYSLFNGTSASAPFVTGAAALIKSLHPTFTPEEVRGILIASADNISGRGWDHFTAAGRLNVATAVSMDDPTVVRITSPKTDAGIASSPVIITGTVASPLMRSYVLQYGFGKNPAQWFDIVPRATRQRIADTLAIWDVSNLKDSTYIIRLAAESDKGITLEDRISIVIDRSPPRFLTVGIIPCINEDGFGIAAGFQTDEPTLGKIWFRKKGTGDPWQWISAEGNTENNLFVGHTHSAYIGRGKLQPGTEYEFYFSAVNKTGLESVHNNKGQNFAAKIDAPIGQLGFAKKPYTLPLSRIFPTASDFDGDGNSEVIINDLANGSALKIMEFDGQAFADRTPGKLLDRYPRAIGDANGNGKLELLASIVRKGLIFESPTAGAFPQSIIWSDTTSKNEFWPCAIADVNDDGKQDVLALTSDTTIGIFTLTASNQMQQLATLVNPTAPPDGGRNAFGSPRVAIADFNGNSRTELLFGDEDGDFFIYETRGGAQFQVTWVSQNEYAHAGDFVAAGDFDGDGTKEIAIGFRTTDDDVIPFWFFTVRKITINNASTPLWEQAFYGVEESGQFGVFSRIQNSMSVGNIDGDAADELIINVFPELYVFGYDAQAKTMAPVWYQPLVNTNAAIIADLDKNGVKEFGVTFSDSVYFYENESAYAGPPLPSAIDVEYQDATSVRIRWSTSGAAPAYNLYRGSSPSDLQLHGRLSSSAASDFGLQPGATYLYAIRAFDSTKTPSESPAVYSRLLHPHDQPMIDSARFIQHGQVEVFVTHDMGTLVPLPLHFRLNGTVQPQSVVLLDQRRILLSFGALPDGDYRIGAPTLRDAEGIPFKPNIEPEFTVVNAVERQFYILRVVYIPENRIDVYFNAPVDPVTASIAANYIFTPARSVASVRIDANDPTLVHVVLAAGNPIGALGAEYRLKVIGVKSSDGVSILTGAGSTAGIIINKQTLEDVFVYPNPFRAGDGVDHVTFANLTPRATIRIYTFSGLFVAEVEETDGNGGVDWNLRDDQGRDVPSGMYMFYATGKNSAGADVEKKVGKFAVVR